MIKAVATPLLAGWALAAAMQANAGVAAIPGTSDVKNVIGTNDRGDILWSHRSNNGFGLTLSRKDASGTYQHTMVDATVAGKGWDYSALGGNGDVGWLGQDAAGTGNAYHYDAATGTVRQLTAYTDTAPHFLVTPLVGGNGSAVWVTFEIDQARIDYFDKPTGQIIRIATMPWNSIARPMAINGRNDVFWLERAADGSLDLRRFDSRARTISVLARRPAGTAPATLADYSLVANDGGDVAWAERVGGTAQEDVFLFDQRAGAVKRITTNTPGRKFAVRVNAVGDVAWKSETQVWLYGARSETAVMVHAKTDYGRDLALDDMGELAFNAQTGDTTAQMYLYKRANGTSTRVRPGVTTMYEGSQALGGSGDLVFTSMGSFGTQGEIVRATRDFSCN